MHAPRYDVRAALRIAGGFALSLLCVPLLHQLPTFALLQLVHVLPRSIDSRYLLFGAQTLLLLAVLLLVRFPLAQAVTRRPPSGGFWDAALFGVGGMMIVFALSVTAALTTSSHDGFSALSLQQAIQRRFSDGGLLGITMYYGVMAPIFEELLYRALILAALMRSAPPWAALAVSAALFAAGHEGWLVAAFYGISFGLLYLRYGNLWIPVMAHSAANVLGLLVPIYVVSRLNDAGLLQALAPQLLPVQILCITLGGSCYWLFFRRLLGKAQARRVLFDWDAAKPVPSCALDHVPECSAASSSPPPTPASSASSAICSRRSAGR